MSLLKRTWYTWKSFALPWRRRRLAGTDLDGNTYWEHTDALGRRPRRIIAYQALQKDHVDYVDYKLTPQWHQWLRYTRVDPPSIAELHEDVARLATLRRNAAIVDARWAAGGTRLVGGAGAGAGAGLVADVGKVADANPWKEADGRGEGFQPGVWEPGVGQGGKREGV